MESNEIPSHLNRRTFLAQAGVAAGALASVHCASTSKAESTAKDPGPRLKKAVKFQMVNEKIPMVDKFKLLRDLGFDGVEMSAPNEIPLDEVLAARDQSGLPIHGVVHSRGWKDDYLLSSPDPESRRRGVESFHQAIRDAKAYGATSVLVVTGKVTKEIAYDDCYARTRECLRQIIPVAAENDIRLLIENVWNNFLLSPLEAAHYVDDFKSPVMGWYFDVGNVVRMGWPEQWIRILNKRIGKLDIKEYSREKQNSEGPGKGFDVEITEGDCDWPAVMKALDDINYAGWATAEVPGGDRERLADISRRMDIAFASLNGRGV